jgi:hypothetical protein
MCRHLRLLCFLLVSVAGTFARPLALYPANPHYFLWKGKPVLLITSGEHYGAVLNLDFQYETYLKELEKEGLNLTRTFTGSYVEPSGAFNITGNTLAPGRDRFICPWARSDQPGYPNGGNKFDLDRWDPAYFKRLKDFMSKADRRGVVVELNLFCPFYDESQWKISPQNAANNVNNVGNVSRTNVYTLDKHGGLLRVHEALVRKLVQELNSYDNLYYEICNEPYFGGVTIEWQHHIADVITDAEKKLRKKHLISQNVANGSAQVKNPHQAISIFNFHYASPPTAVAVNHGLGKVIGDNETGFRGTNNLHYRMEAWDFVMAGGALFNNLDYSFIAGREDGTFTNYPTNQPGGGNPQYRQQLKTLRQFIYSLDFTRMKVDNGLIKGGVPAGAHARAVSAPDGKFALYISPSMPHKEGNSAEARIAMELPPGSYKVRWINPVTAEEKTDVVNHKMGGRAELRSPVYAEDMAALISRTK